MTFTIELPYPPPILSPNARVHWTKVHAARKEQRAEAYALTRGAVGYPRGGLLGSAHITIEFCPRSKRRYDLDNSLSACKGMIDGIASALGVDDSKFDITLKRGAPRKGGAVIVTVEAR